MKIRESLLFICIICLCSAGCETEEEKTVPNEICNNQFDDDGDGDMDCLDADCDSATVCQIALENCTNGTDDDFDSDVDCDDADCSASVQCNPQEDCDNEADDDGDGDTDCDDADCDDAADCQPPENCTNGIDDNGDGNVDCDDTACSQTPSCLQQVCSIYTVFYDSPQVCNMGEACGVDYYSDFSCMPAASFAGGSFYGACGPGYECPVGSICFGDDSSDECLPLCSDAHSNCPPGGSCTYQEFGIDGLYFCDAD